MSFSFSSSQRSTFGSEIVPSSASSFGSSIFTLMSFASSSLPVFSLSVPLDDEKYLSLDEKHLSFVFQFLAGFRSIVALIRVPGKDDEINLSGDGFGGVFGVRRLKSDRLRIASRLGELGQVLFRERGGLGNVRSCLLGRSSLFDVQTLKGMDRNGFEVLSAYYPKHLKLILV